MKIEHFAINVEEPVSMADWYVRHMGMSIIRQQTEAPFTTFLADKSGHVLIEIYKSSKAPIPNYKNQNPLVMHFAFVSKHPQQDKIRLQKAGASEISDNIAENGDHLVMLRDPWGIPIQLCNRVNTVLNISK